MSGAGQVATQNGIAVVEQAIATAVSAGADQADIVLVRGRSLEARVRGETVDFVKQAGEIFVGCFLDARDFVRRGKVRDG